jgi:hypothetical protein
MIVDVLHRSLRWVLNVHPAAIGAVFVPRTRSLHPTYITLISADVMCITVSLLAVVYDACPDGVIKRLIKTVIYRKAVE